MDIAVLRISPYGVYAEARRITAYDVHQADPKYTS
jgi:hypothetical protein